MARKKPFATCSEVCAPCCESYTGHNKIEMALWTIVAVTTVGLACLFVLTLIWYLDIKGMLQSFFAFLSDLGIWGYIMMGVLMAIMNVPLCCMYLPMCALCGFMYGLWWGLVVVVVGGGVGMLVVFLFLRYAMQHTAKKYIESHGGYLGRAIFNELQEQSTWEHVNTIVLVRLAAPFPPGLQNTLLAASSTSLWLYQSVSMVSMLIKQIPAVYVGSTLSYIAQWRKDDEISGSDIVIFVLGLIGIVILIAVMLYYSKRILDRARKLRQDEEQGEDLDTLVGNHSDDEDGEWPKHHHSEGLLMDEDELDQPV